MLKEERFRPYAAVYLVLLKEGKILLHKRKGCYYPDHYSLVSGHLDGGETVFASIKREAFEEAGIIIQEKDLTVVHTMHRCCPDREYIDFYISTDSWEGDITNKEPDKCGGLDWFSLKNLPENMVPEVHFALKEMNKKNHYSTFGWR